MYVSYGMLSRVRHVMSKVFDCQYIILTSHCLYMETFSVRRHVNTDPTSAIFHNEATKQSTISYSYIIHRSNIVYRIHIITAGDRAVPRNRTYQDTLVSNVKKQGVDWIHWFVKVEMNLWVAQKAAHSLLTEKRRTACQ